MQIPFIYFGKWEWFSNSNNQSYWRAPNGSSIGCLDLRSINESSKMGGIAQGYGIFVYNSLQVNPNLIVNIGDSLAKNLSTTEKNQIETFIKLPLNSIQSNTLVDVLWDILTIFGDVTGAVRCKPILPTVDGKLELHLGGFSLIREEKFDLTKHSFVLEVEKENYRQVRKESLKGNFQRITFHREFLQALVEKYKLPASSFIPSDLPEEIPLTHSTTITDNFNRADNGLGADWTVDAGTWAIRTNQAAVTAGTDYAPCRYTTTAMATADHWSEFAYNTRGNGNGPTTRKINTSELTFYATIDQGVGNSFFQKFKRIAGAWTQLSSDSFTFTSGFIIRLQINGSSLQHWYNSVELGSSVTDTSITGNLRVGMVNLATAARHDDFQAQDVAAAAVETTFIFSEGTGTVVLPLTE